MALPAINLPQIELPLAVPELIHPAVVHFAIAIPVIVLLLEFYNLFARRKTIGGFSFILLIITVVVLVVSYFTGGVDGKAAYDLLSPEGQEALKAHKILSVYVMIASLIVLFFKLLAMTGKGFFKFLFFIALMGLIAITLNQGKEGGALVYKYGANIEVIKDMKFDLDDLKEELAEAEEEKTEEKKPLETATVEAPAVTQTVETVVPSEPTQVEVEANASL